jgi:hypothetical protein
MRRRLRAALESNLAAARLERSCGRAVEAQADAMPLDIALPSLRTAAGCTLAIDKLTAAIVQGTIETDKAKMLVDVIQARLKAIEVNELADRLDDLEKTAATVEGRGAIA